MPGRAEAPLPGTAGGKSPFPGLRTMRTCGTSVVEGVVDAIWFNQGQVLCAGSRILVPREPPEALTAKLKGST